MLNSCFAVPAILECSWLWILAAPSRHFSGTEGELLVCPLAADGAGAVQLALVSKREFASSTVHVIMRP